MIGTDIDKAIQLLKAENVVAIPTETVYGLAGNALSSKAVADIFSIKNRPSFDPLIIHTSDLNKIGAFVQEIPDLARRLAEHFMPGPLTLLLPKTPAIPDIVTAGSERVAIRIPNHPVALKLLDALPFPLAAPSANPFGYISPTTAKHVADQLGGKIKYILDGGPCSVGLESTILGFENGHPTIFRKGGTTIEAIEKVIDKVEIKPFSTSNPQAPGMLKSHYAPKAPVILGDLQQLIKEHSTEKVGVITFHNRIEGIPGDHQLILSPNKDMREAAQRLFAGMRQLDQQELDIILAELVPEEGLGVAINDRLRRAAAL
jgi:L-threonylcarbamoyladenylate synthase